MIEVKMYNIYSQDRRMYYMGTEINTILECTVVIKSLTLWI